MTDMGRPDPQPEAAAHPSAPTGAAGRDHHIVQPQPWLAGASDRGQRHETNQDALSLAGREVDGRRFSVMVISDGVSSSQGAEQAALTAATEASGRLVTALAEGRELQSAFDEAFERANLAVVAEQQPARAGSCTLIAAVTDGSSVTVGNVGDSRGYFIADSGPSLVLSTDDSVAQARIELGMSREDAENSFQAHAITRWLGPDAPDVSPRLENFSPLVPGWLLLCSDGLWNYASEAAEMAELVHGMGHAVEPLALAEHLVAWANQQGGRDNITVAVTRLAPALAQHG